jgi:hypothetical protein
MNVKLNRAQLKFTGLDLGKIQNVVEDRHQRIRRFFDRAKIFPLLAVHSLLQRKFGHPQNAVHRCADLVTHVGQKLALGAAPALGGKLGAAQLAVIVNSQRQQAADGNEEKNMMTNAVGWRYHTSGT